MDHQLGFCVESSKWRIHVRMMLVVNYKVLLYIYSDLKVF